MRYIHSVIVTLAILSLSITTVYAQDSSPMIKQGNQELGISGNAKLSKESQVNLDIKYGWFLLDAWEVGVTLSPSYADDNFRIQGGVFTEYNFMLPGILESLVPFAGLSAEIGFVNFNDEGTAGDFDEDATAFVLGVGFGLKYFIRPGIALTGSAGFEYAIGDSLFGAAGDAKDAAADINIGLRVYF